MPSSPDLVILFTRYPRAGKCKTRLIPALGAEGAIRVHQRLVTHILQELRYCIQRDNTKLQIHYDGGSLAEMQRWLGRSYSFIQQKGEDLGQRMSRALTQALDQGRNVILLGSDCPAVTATLLKKALDSLQEHDMVLGPAHDGGYYLIGLRREVDRSTCRNLFSHIPWSTAPALAETLQRATRLNLNLPTLPPLHDIARAEDLRPSHPYPHPQ